MVVLDKTIEIRAPPDRVWRLLTCLASAPRWSPGLVRAAPRDGHDEVRPGLVFRTVREDLGLHLESEQETVAADPPRRFAWRQIAGDFERYDGYYELVATSRGHTRVRLRLALELPFVLPRLLREDDIRRYYSSRHDEALLRLKEELESGRQTL